MGTPKCRVSSVLTLKSDSFEDAMWNAVSLGETRILLLRLQVQSQRNALEFHIALS
jgi:hypothetical protein